MNLHKQTKVIIIACVVIIIIAAGSVFAYRKIKSRNSAKSPAENGQTQTASSNQSAAQDQTVDSATGQAVDSGDNAPADNSASPDNSTSTDSSSSSSSASSGNTNLDLNKNDSTTSGKMLAHITTQHCNDNCQAFANDLSLLEYCQQVCGITPVKKVSSCSGKDGIEKDYCLKDLGVTKDDTSICDQISDTNVKTTCKNRVLQDIIEQQTPSSGE